jgi:transposase
MEVVHVRCAGLDISKKDAKVCVRVQGTGGRRTSTTVTTWGAMTNDILRLRDHLVAEKVTCVVMESTGDYWKPFYYVLEDALPVMLVNPREARNRPGRKTDLLTELPQGVGRRCVPAGVGLARFAVCDQ